MNKRLATQAEIELLYKYYQDFINHKNEVFEELEPIEIPSLNEFAFNTAISVVEASPSLTVATCTFISDELKDLQENEHMDFERVHLLQIINSNHVMPAPKDNPFEVNPEFEETETDFN